MNALHERKLIESGSSPHPIPEKDTLAKSTFLWILILLALTNALWGTLRPLQFVPHTSQPNLELSKSALRFKMDELQHSASAPDIMLIGSSLPMCAFFYTEGPGYFDLAEGKKIRDLKLNLLQAYPEAGYFTAQLKKQTGKNFKVFNFAGAACMASDTKLVLERAVGAGRKPSMIIYGVGLRDFVDNVNPPPGETPYYKALCNPPFIWRHLPYMMRMNAFNDLAVGSICKIYDLRNEFRSTAEYAACKFLHHPTSIELAFILADLNKQAATASGAAKVQQAAPPENVSAPSGIPAKQSAASPAAQNPGQRESAVADENKSSGNGASQAPTTLPSAASVAAAAQSKLAVLDYPQRYSPANYHRLNAEMHELKNLIKYCKDQNIKLVLMNMPVSQGHKQVSPPGLRERYLKALRSIANGATLFIDYEDASLPDSNFFDTVHLNPEGAVKFVNEISARLETAGLLND